LGNKLLLAFIPNVILSSGVLQFDVNETLNAECISNLNDVKYLNSFNQLGNLLLSPEKSIKFKETLYDKWSANFRSKVNTISDRDFIESYIWIQNENPGKFVSLFEGKTKIHTGGMYFKSLFWISKKFRSNATNCPLYSTKSNFGLKFILTKSIYW